MKDSDYNKFILRSINQLRDFVYEKFNRSNIRSTIILKNVLVSFAIKGINIAISFLVVPLVLGYVSPELYGIWLILSSIIAWFYFFDIGLTVGLKNKLTEAISLKNYEKAKSLVSTTYGTLIILLVPLCSLILIIIPHVNWCVLLNINITYKEEIQRTLYVLVAFFFLQMILNTLSSVVMSFQKTALASFFGMLGQLFALIIIFCLTRIVPPSLMALCFAYMGAPVFVLLAATIIMYTNSKLKIVAPSLRFFNKQYISELLGLGIKFFIIQIQVIILYQSTNILISHIVNPEAVAQYNVAYKYITAAEMIFVIILTPIWPSFTEAYTLKDFGWMQSIYKRLTRIYMFIASIIIILVILSPWVYHIWLGDKIFIPIFMSISIGIYTLIHSWTSMQVYLINGVGKVKLQVYVTIIGSIIHIPLSLFLGKYIGAVGVVYSMGIIAFIYSIFFTIQIRRIINNQAFGIWAK